MLRVPICVSFSAHCASGRVSTSVAVDVDMPRAWGGTTAEPLPTAVGREGEQRVVTGARLLAARAPVLLRARPARDPRVASFMVVTTVARGDCTSVEDRRYSARSDDTNSRPSEPRGVSAWLSSRKNHWQVLAPGGMRCDAKENRRLKRGVGCKV